jgi:hypothetical protein
MRLKTILPYNLIIIIPALLPKAFLWKGFYTKRLRREIILKITNR